MKTPAAPSVELLRYLRAQSVHDVCARPPPWHHQRRPQLQRQARLQRLFSSGSTCQSARKNQSNVLDELWPRHRTTQPQPASQSRWASHSSAAASRPSWLWRWWHRRRRPASSSGPGQPVAAAEGGEQQSYDDATAQLFNLNRALSRIPSGGELKLRCTEFDANGSVTIVAGEFKKSELIAKYGLLPRDLRKIDSSVLPHILVRPSAILLNLLHLRVLIQSDRVLVFDAYGSTDSYTQSLFMYDLEGKLRQKADPRSPSSASLPYEFRALEAVLISVTSGLEAEFILVRDPVAQVLQELEEDIDREKLRHLLILSKKLGTFEQKARLVRDAIEDLLNADDDLAAMYLTERKRTGRPRDENDHQEIEMLLESYHKICDEIVEVSGNLISNIRNTEEVVKAILDANRNELMLLSLKVAIGTLGLAGGTLVAGLYGMNLENFMEESNYGFGAVTAVTTLITVVISVYGLRKLRKLQKVRMWDRGIHSYHTPAPGAVSGGAAPRIAVPNNWYSVHAAGVDHAALALKHRTAAAVAAAGTSAAAAATNRVLWPGMDGLGMHRLGGTSPSALNADANDAVVIHDDVDAGQPQPDRRRPVAPAKTTASTSTSTST